MKKVLILFGGNSTEHFISCKSAKTILDEIDREKYEVTSVGISKENVWYLWEEDQKYLEDGTWIEHTKERIENPVSFLKKFDVVFPITHGNYGEDGKLQGFLDLFEIPYVGCKTLSSAISMDKSYTKEIVYNHHIPQVPFRILRKGTTLKEEEFSLTYPVIVKPCNGGSSIGIKKADNFEELKEAVDYAFTFDDKIIIEKFIHARELECGILEHNGIHVSKVGEIKSANAFYDYEAKYIKKESTVEIPADIKEEVKRQIQTYAKEIFNILDGKGLARVDFFFKEEENKIYFNEINTLPGFTTISMYPKVFESE